MATNRDLHLARRLQEAIGNESMEDVLAAEARRFVAANPGKPIGDTAKSEDAGLVANFMADLRRITDASPRWRACIATFVSHEGSFLTLSSPDEYGELDFLRAALDEHTGDEGYEDE